MTEIARDDRPALGPDAISTRVFGDVRMLAVAVRALLLQVAHPVVGAGVTQHSDFAADPWGRLVRTLDAVTPVVYGTEARAAAVGERLRVSHRGIIGTDEAGRRYTALDPEAYHWVHATLFDAALTGAKVFGPRIRPDEMPQLYDEYLLGGRRLGVSPEVMPPDFASWERYRRTMIAEVLEPTAAAREVLAVLRRPVPPPVLPDALEPIWPLAWAPLGHVARVSATALCPAPLRDRLGLRLRPRHRAEMALLGGAVRAAFAALPAEQRLLPQARRERRRTARAVGG